jgi:ribosomal protein S27AE
MQRTVSFTMPDGGETVRERFTRTTEFCVKCGKQGTWANGDHSRLVCTTCKTVTSRDNPTYQAKPTDVFGVIARQLKASTPAN